MRAAERERERAAAPRREAATAKMAELLTGACSPCEVGAVDWKALARCTYPGCVASVGHHMTHAHVGGGGGGV